ncbi:hypothetical protein ACG0Z6_02715 [Roseateles sp. BYS180W]|uniref:DUF3019 domain-containing protein n=1 Tax=Roseateles rivi TaxID=3299028 RepID=A0ABW7FS44_9BURK
MKLHLNSRVLAAVLGTCVTAVQAKPSLEDWRTPISCGGQQFEVVSRCKAATKSMALNACEPGQRLTLGDKTIRIPTRPAGQGQAPLFAVLWSCLETSQGPILLLDYTSGQGRAEGDEDAEFFDSQLQVIKDPAKQRKLYKSLPQAKKGAVKSIMPGEGG